MVKIRANSVLTETIEHKILLIRGHAVLIDADFATLYGVTTKRLNEQIKRNKKRFPYDFMFQLTADEKYQVVANCDHLTNLKYSHTNPYVFTEHGAIMAANVLSTKHAIDISILVVRTFVKLRTMLTDDEELRHKLRKIEEKITDHDELIQNLARVIRQLISPSILKTKNKHTIGFAAWNDK